jgi:hypothetical protein
MGFLFFEYCFSRFFMHSWCCVCLFCPFLCCLSCCFDDLPDFLFASFGIDLNRLAEAGDRHRKKFFQGMQKTAEKAALGLQSGLSKRAFMWTFDSSHEDEELERFFSNLPGFRKSNDDEDSFPSSPETKRRISGAAWLDSWTAHSHPTGLTTSTKIGEPKFALTPFKLIHRLSPISSTASYLKTSVRRCNLPNLRVSSKAWTLARMKTLLYLSKPSFPVLSQPHNYAMTSGLPLPPKIWASRIRPSKLHPTRS